MKDKNTYISVTLTDDPTIKKLNKTYLKRDHPTDVLSFKIDVEMEDGTNYLGDIIVSKDRAEKQAGEYGNTLEQEISELVAHGVLHLLGVHHEGDE